MAVFRGRIGTLAIDDGGGSDLIGKIVDIDFDGEAAEITVTAHDSDDWEEYLQGRKNVTMTVTCRADESDAGQSSAVDAWLAETVVTVLFRQRGATSGALEYSSSGFVRSVSKPSPNDEEGKFNITIRLTGTVTQATQP